MLDQRGARKPSYGTATDVSRFVGHLLHGLFFGRFALNQGATRAGFVERFRMMEQRTAGKTLCGATGNTSNGLVHGLRIRRRSHHLVCYIVSLLFVSIIWFGDVELCLDAVCRHPVRESG